MNLIEQLGGYAQAKEKLESLNEQLYKMMEPERFLLEMDNQQKLSVVISSIEIAMLDYRRQHNIYEVGDDVVLSGGNCTLLYKLYERIGKYVYLKRPSGREYDFHIDEIRHATDAEIQAGKRL